jgi:hypothetical protein
MTTLPSISPSKTDAALRRFPAKLALGGTAVALPVGFLAYKHIGWMKTPQAKKRMAVTQATFWSGMAACITLLHSGAFWKRFPFTSIAITGPMRAFIGLAGGLVGALSFKGGLMLGNKLFPKGRQTLDTHA